MLVLVVWVGGELQDELIFGGSRPFPAWAVCVSLEKSMTHGVEIEGGGQHGDRGCIIMDHSTDNGGLLLSGDRSLPG